MKRNKIALVIAIVFFAFMAFYSAWNDLRDDQQLLSNVSLVESRLNDITEINTVITQLQKERGLTAIYHANSNDGTKTALTTQRQQTTAILRAPYKTALIEQVILDRDRILRLADQPNSMAEIVFNRYSTIIMQLMQESENLIFKTQDADIKNLLIIYHLLKNAQESAGRLRAKVGTALASNLLTDKNHQDIIALDAIYHNLISKSHRHLPPRFRSLIDDFQMRPCVDQTFSVVQDANNRALEKISQTPLEWFKLSTCAIEHLNKLGNQHLKMLQTKVSATKDAAKSTMLKHLVFWSGGLITLLILLIIVLKNSKALARKHQLLENYQEAIDYSTIVSKADKNGVITYVNNAFCEISGYSSDELLQQPHNIVRHPDMPKEVFKMMWGDIQQGKKWQGIIKNLKKDGTSYWVDASISPIFDDK
ncbi:MAG: nitrate- and nitrite sensing domain-containing protein, partial [Sulfurimonadaceae bacterium]